MSGKRAAKKAAKKAFKRGDSPEDFGLRRPRAVAETLAGMIRSGGAYIGFQSGMSDDALRGLLGIAHAMGLKAELRGGGKRRHAGGALGARGRRVPRDGERAAGGGAIASGGEGEPYDGGGRRRRRAAAGVRGCLWGEEERLGSQLLCPRGVMQNDDEAVTEGAGMTPGSRIRVMLSPRLTLISAPSTKRSKKANFDRTDLLRPVSPSTFS